MALPFEAGLGLHLLKGVAGSPIWMPAAPILSFNSLRLIALPAPPRSPVKIKTP